MIGLALHFHTESSGLQLHYKLILMKAQFYYCHNELGRNSFNRYGLLFSQKFCEYFSENFTKLFYAETGLRPSTKVTLAGYKQQNEVPIYQPGSVSKLNLVLWIMPEYNDNISFCWKSTTGEIVKPTDENFNEDNLECWMEGLKPIEYWEQVATEKKVHPFQIANLTFELNVFDFGVQMELRIHADSDHEEIKISIANTIQAYNDSSEINNRKNGVVHHYKFHEQKSLLYLQIDTGSAGIEIIKKILKSLATINAIKRVEVDI